MVNAVAKLERKIFFVLVHMVCTVSSNSTVVTDLSFVSLDHSKGFGGKYGVQKDHMDKVLTFSSNCMNSRIRVLDILLTGPVFLLIAHLLCNDQGSLSYN